MTPRLALGASSLLLVLAHPLGPAAAAAPRPQTQEGADATVVGRVVGVDGAPVAGVPISVVETDTGAYFPLFNPLRPTYTDDTTESGPDGTYRGVLPRAYIPGTETDYDWVVTASRPAGAGETEGPTSSFEFETNTAVQEAPDLPLWDATPVVSVDGYRAEVSIPGGKPVGPSYAYVSLNSATKPGPGGVFDLRAAEPDAQAGSGLVVRGQAWANVTVHHAEGRTIYHQSIESAQVEAELTPADVALVPVSRDAPCVVALTDGQAAPDEPCQATDGRLQEVVTAERTEAVPPTTAVDEAFVRQPGVVSITVELPGDTALGSVSVRGCDRTCDVEISADGSTWARPHRSSVEAIDSSNAMPVVIASFEPVVDARFVRVGKSGESLSVYEISAWPPGPEPDPPPTSSVVPAGVPPAPEQAIARPAEGSPASGRAVAPPLVAAALVATVGAGLVAEVTRRRRAG